MHSKGEKVTAKAHGQTIDIQGVTVAHVDDQLRVTKLETWFDPMDMFRQIAPEGIVNKVSIEQQGTETGQKAASEATADVKEQKTKAAMEASKPAPEPKVELNGDHADAALVDVKKDADSVKDLAEDIRLANLDNTNEPANVTGTTEKSRTASAAETGTGQCPFAGQAVAVKSDSEEAKATFREMSKLTPLECPFMNVE